MKNFVFDIGCGSKYLEVWHEDHHHQRHENYSVTPLIEMNFSPLRRKDKATKLQERREWVMLALELAKGKTITDLKRELEQTNDA
jgi:hypothetical protein